MRHQGLSCAVCQLQMQLSAPCNAHAATAWGRTTKLLQSTAENRIRFKQATLQQAAILYAYCVVQQARLHEPACLHCHTMLLHPAQAAMWARNLLAKCCCQTNGCDVGSLSANWGLPAAASPQVGAMVPATVCKLCADRTRCPNICSVT